MVVRSPEVGQYALDAFNLRTRRLVTLTDRAYWAPTLGAPPGDLCGQPWVARPAGAPLHTWTTPARTLYFVEYPAAAGAATLFVAPLDLSTPPRALASMVPSLLPRAPAEPRRRAHRRGYRRLRHGRAALDPLGRDRALATALTIRHILRVAVSASRRAPAGAPLVQHPRNQVGRGRGAAAGCSSTRNGPPARRQPTRAIQVSGRAVAGATSVATGA